MAPNKLNKAIAQRNNLRSRLARFETFLSQLDTQPELGSQLDSRLEAIRSIWSEFDAVQREIAEQDPSNDHEEENNSFENYYFKLVTDAKARLQVSGDNKNSIISHVDATSITQTNVKLPQLDLPNFNGSYDQWSQFRDTFDALINKNAGLSKVQKFYYLQAALKDDASQVIHSLQLTENNYDIAWNLLTERYENKRAMIQSHIKAIVDIPIVNKESHTHLRNFLDTFQRHFRSLQKLEENSKYWDAILIFLLISKLDKSTKREWENFIRHELTNDVSPTVTNFTKFLSQRCSFLESLEMNTTANAQYDNNKKYTNTKSLVHVSTSQDTCPLCKQFHFIYRCTRFLDLSPNARLSEAKRLNLCTNCLRPNHSAVECRSSSCRTCSKKHNSLLHVYTDFHSRTNAESRNIPANTSRNTQDNTSRNTYTNAPRNVHSNTTRTAHSNTHRNSQQNPLSSQATFQSNNAENHSTRSNNQTSTNTQESSQTQSHCITSAHCNQYSTQSTVLLSTAVVYIHDVRGTPIKCRCLLDNGSQSNFLTEHLFKKLELNYTNIDLPVSGINQCLTKITKATKAEISKPHTNFHTKLNFLIIDSITDMTPQKLVNVSHLQIPESIKLADPGFHRPGSIDMLIGASIFYDLLCSGQMKLGHGKPTLHKTKLGWIVSGSVGWSKQNSTLCHFAKIHDDIHAQLEDFWVIEELPQPLYTKEQQECETHFVNTVKRNESGRFSVQLPFKNEPTRLGNSLDHALQRFYSLEHRLSKNPHLKSQYTSFIDEYISLNHMSEILPDAIDIKPHYYLPHHAVEKLSSATTKLRVVFDASAKTSTGLSLNDVLRVGPTIQDDLFSILIRFRKHNVVLTADISKMYRQVRVESSHCDMQRIVWRSNPTDSIKHYRLETVTYGTSSASFLSTRCLTQLAIESSNDFPKESSVIKSDFYVDDLLTGSHDHESLQKLKNNLEKILNSGGFQLRQFITTDPRVLESSEQQHNSISHYTIQADQSSKTLGISWDCLTDCFLFTSVNTELKPKVITKRTILSAISQIFDPLGLLQPVVINAKLILQRLWQVQIDWDAPVPPHLQLSWLTFSSQLKNITSIDIPRHALLASFTSLEMHGFCDSSEKAYGACIYLVSRDSVGNSKSVLLCSKSRVAPLKTISIPRLELCGALLLSRLISKVTIALKIDISCTYCWTDSTIVLAWLAAEPSIWKVFVSNRIAEIQQLTTHAEWLHVPSALNPADLLSRGTTVNDLARSSFWFNGPDYLMNVRDQTWPKQFTNSIQHSDIVKSEQRSLREHTIITLTSTFTQDIIQRFSSFSRLQRVIAYCLRFISNLKSTCIKRKFGNLSVDEIKQADTCLIKIVQSETFSSDIETLKRSKTVKPSSSLASLNPFLDAQGIIRVGGRLKHSNLSYSQKYPVLIPKNHHLTTLVVRHIHIINLHSGVQATLSFLRQQYWLIGGKGAVKRVIRSCVTCFKSHPTSTFPQMGDLPSVRVIPSRAFDSCGVDYAGPFPLKDGNTRSRKIIKSYICIFVCLSTKAVHIELVTSMTSSCFLDAFKRFVSRRGLCSNVYSDNATNFTCANKELHVLFDSFAKHPEFSDYLTISHINWHFIPARSPHFGGIWEASVKTAKNHLKRITQKTNFNYEQFSTMLVQIEAVMNSRPILPLSTDPNDLEALTPGHFLIGTALNVLPSHAEDSRECNLTSKFKHIQFLVSQFWFRWRNEYLHTLQLRTKWKFRKEPESLLGALVVLREDNSPVNCWPLGRVMELHPGTDGVVRVVSVQTRNGVLKRAVARVCVIPMEQ